MFSVSEIISHFFKCENAVAIYPMPSTPPDSYEHFNKFTSNYLHFQFSFILRDVRPHIPKGYVYTLHDIGLVTNKLMGGAYR